VLPRANMSYLSIRVHSFRSAIISEGRLTFGSTLIRLSVRGLPKSIEPDLLGSEAIEISVITLDCRAKLVMVLDFDIWLPARREGEAGMLDRKGELEGKPNYHQPSSSPNPELPPLSRHTPNRCSPQKASNSARDAINTHICIPGRSIPR
jgi:hypothetical protein